MYRLLLPVALLALCGGSSLLASRELEKCVAGELVVDREGRSGEIVADSDKLCRVRYPDGQTYSWIYWNLRSAEEPPKPSPTRSETNRSREATGTAGSTGTSPGLTILRPSSSHALVYHADRRGHFNLKAIVNGAPINFIVDTGASLVALTLDDARAAGIGSGELVFNGITQTANGRVRFASVMLHEIRIDQLLIENVRAAVIENLSQSLLGMNFLNRLKSFELREGTLTIGW